MIKGLIASIWVATKPVEELLNRKTIVNIQYRLM
jgi:hypothetical protein